jgi:hypothetical protein
MGARLVPVLSRRRVMGERCEAIEERFVRDAAGVGRDPRAILAQGGSATRDATILVRCVLRIGVDLSLFDRYVAWQIASTQRLGADEERSDGSPDLRNAEPKQGGASPDLRNADPKQGGASPDLRNAEPKQGGASPDSGAPTQERKVAPPILGTALQKV